VRLRHAIGTVELALPGNMTGMVFVNRRTGATSRLPAQ
jgi:hypothetical protein